jgi:hypothetical protein
MKKILRISVVLLVIAGVAYGYYRSKYPYGSTHRCSKVLAGYLEEYANSHDGNYPQPVRPDQLGLELLLDANLGDSDLLLELVVGKAGDLSEARRFYAEHGYLKPEHSSWNYVTGVSAADKGRAIAWDKIPLPPWCRSRIWVSSANEHRQYELD